MNHAGDPVLNSAGDTELTPDQAARRLQFSRTTIYRLVDEGKLAAVRAGTGRGRLLIPESEIRAYRESITRRGRERADKLSELTRQIRRVRFDVD